ncbi:hypothetical protein Pelo_9552 [Pelomyxa schiedti]|nr:hypothetical protein Pelo_9552 [Pelomyxa schiedti]
MSLLKGAATKEQLLELALELDKFCSLDAYLCRRPSKKWFWIGAFSFVFMVSSIFSGVSKALFVIMLSMATTGVLAYLLPSPPDVSAAAELGRMSEDERAAAARLVAEKLDFAGDANMVSAFWKVKRQKATNAQLESQAMALAQAQSQSQPRRPGRPRGSTNKETPPLCIHSVCAKICIYWEFWCYPLCFFLNVTSCPNSNNDASESRMTCQLSVQLLDMDSGYELISQCLFVQKGLLVIARVARDKECMAVMQGRHAALEISPQITTKREYLSAEMIGCLPMSCLEITDSQIDCFEAAEQSLDLIQ